MKLTTLIILLVAASVCGKAFGYCNAYGTTYSEYMECQRQENMERTSSHNTYQSFGGSSGGYERRCTTTYRRLYSGQIEAVEVCQ